MAQRDTYRYMMYIVQGDPRCKEALQYYQTLPPVFQDIFCIQDYRAVCQTLGSRTPEYMRRAEVPLVVCNKPNPQSWGGDNGVQFMEKFARHIHERDGNKQAHGVMATMGTPGESSGKYNPAERNMNTFSQNTSMTFGRDASVITDDLYQGTMVAIHDPASKSTISTKDIARFMAARDTDPHVLRRKALGGDSDRRPPGGERGRRESYDDRRNRRDSYQDRPRRESFGGSGPGRHQSNVSAYH